jgi:GDP-mannose 6-dehydrogenase
VGRLRATLDAAEAVRATDVSIVCVGTPSAPNGKLDLSYLAGVSREIGTALRGKTERHVLIVRSTVLPGTVEEQVIPILEAAVGRRVGDGYTVLYNPEFLREGTAIADFFAPPLTIVGNAGGADSDAARELYRDVQAPFHVVPVRVAEMVKYSANAFHALKIAFANEIGRIAKCLGADSHSVMDYLCQDTKLNISRAYLRPGFAFGGSCLPKDLRALTYKAKELDAHVPVLQAILASNEEHVQAALNIVLSTGLRKVGLLGLSFKPGTDDLRESPLVALAERLIGKGYELRVFDPLVSLDHLVGANKTYILREIPHISRLMAPGIESVLDSSDVMIIKNASREFKVLETRRFAPNHVVVDLAGLLKGKLGPEVKYHGVCW